MKRLGRRREDEGGGREGEIQQVDRKGGRDRERDRKREREVVSHTFC